MGEAYGGHQRGSHTVHGIPGIELPCHLELKPHDSLRPMKCEQEPATANVQFARTPSDTEVVNTPSKVVREAGVFE